MSKDLSTLKLPETAQAALERQARKLLPDTDLDTLYEAQCDVCGRGTVQEAEYSLVGTEGTILRVWCSFRCLANDDLAAVVATIGKILDSKAKAKKNLSR